MPRKEEPGNLWIAKVLYDLGGVQFGDFSLGRSTRHSPIYINPRLLVSNPKNMKRIARILDEEVQAKLEKANPEMSPFELVAGVPYGGLHMATAFSLKTNTPLVYVNPRDDTEKRDHIEGRYKVGQRVLLIDDLMTTGGSILENARAFSKAYVDVRDVLVLIDRDQGGRERLKAQGLNVVSLLNLRVMLTYYMSIHYITENWYHKCNEYLNAHRYTGAEAESDGN